MDKRIVVVGTGYVGLSNAILLAQHNEVIAVDLLPKKVHMINNGESPLKDKEIEDYLESGNLNLTATTDGDMAYMGADFVIVSTPTDYDPEEDYFNTDSVESVVEQVRKLNPSAYIVIKSTVPIGFTRAIQEKFDTDHILFSPEFLREGQALKDNLHPSRIIVGANMESGESVVKAKEFAGLLKEGALKEDVPVLIMETTEAEAVKLFANMYLAMRVSYFNELDTYAEAQKLDTESIIRGVCYDLRIGGGYNNPSFGYGGYCFPKDTKQLLANYKGIPQNIIGAVVDSNITRKGFIAEQIIKTLNKRKEDRSVAGVYLLAMKTGSDNFRQSAILDIIEILKKRDIEIIIYEPALKENLFMGCKVIRDIDAFKAVCDIIIANRKTAELKDVADKVYTRDIFLSD